MTKRIAVLIDGGHLRVYTRKAGKLFVPDYIEKIAHNCALADEVIQRILYYNCRPYEGEATLPVSGPKRHSAAPTNGCTIFRTRTCSRCELEF